MPVLKNTHWEDYAQARAKGLSQRKAYREAYPAAKSWKDETVDNKAYALEKKSEVLARYEEIKQEAANAAGGAVLTRNEKRMLLAKMARDERLPIKERRAAIDIDNKMEREYVTRVEGSMNIEKLEDLL